MRTRITRRAAALAVCAACVAVNAAQVQSQDSPTLNMRTIQPQESQDQLVTLEKNLLD